MTVPGRKRISRRGAISRALAAPFSIVIALGLVLGLSVAPATAQDSGPQELVRAVLDDVVGELRSNKALRNDTAALGTFVDERVLPYFDFRRMSQRVLGRHWRAATDSQKDGFVTEFKALLVRTYSTAMAQYADDDVKLIGTRERKPGKHVSVRARLEREAGPAVPVNFELYNGSAGWKVFDVAVDGISLVINYRGTFDREVRRDGLDALIERLRNGG